MALGRLPFRVIGVIAYIMPTLAPLCLARICRSDQLIREGSPAA